MNATAEKIQKMRELQLTRSMRAAAILGFFTVLGSLSRIWFIGWHNIMYLHIALYLIILGAVVFDRRLSFNIRAAIISGAAFIAGVNGLVIWGFAAFSLVALFSFCILCTMLFGRKAGIISCVVCITAIGIAGACVYFGILVFKFNPLIQLNSPILWLTSLFAMAMSAGIIVVALGTLNWQVEGLIEILEKQKRELLEKNMLLENEIAERIRMEAERRKLEERLQLARKMESIGNLAGGVAHDLNNTLGSIVGYPDLMLEELPANSPLRDQLETIKKTGIKAAAIVNDMLTLARSGIVTTEVFSLNSVVLEYFRSPEFQQLISFHPKAEIELRLDKESLNVRGSFFHLSKVVMNLVSNAAEAMPDGGQIVISTEKQKISGGAGMHGEILEGEYAVLCVADTGIGIPREDLDRIFEPFFTKKTMGRSGTGLGMAVVWGSVKDHNGHIAVESIEGKGTKFIVYFPLTMEELTYKKSLVPQTAPMGRGESILVIDDVREQREIASRILGKMGYSVYAVGSGEEAIAYLRRASADLLILDMLMDPGMDGLETYRKILEFHPGQKAIIATGFSETSRVREALSLGVGTCLKKPYLLDQIGFAVRAELDRRPRSQGGSAAAVESC
jgi:signal transduction histidine kinase/ActR/RegA family two-component response regulator